MKLYKTIKSKLLTKWFSEWLDTETDVELLYLTKKMITQREESVTGIKPVMGFRSYTTECITKPTM